MMVCNTGEEDIAKSQGGPLAINLAFTRVCGLYEDKIYSYYMLRIWSYQNADSRDSLTRGNIQALSKRKVKGNYGY